jgi:hypothetical protein
MATASIDDLARRARFIFRGTVERLGAATMSGVPISEATAIVKVEEVILAPSVLGDLTGKDVTVELTAARTEDQGRHAVFFADPWLYGDGVAVREIGRQELPPRADAERRRVSEQVSRTLERLPDEELRQHLDEVEAVIVGRVVNARPRDLPGQSPASEHDPQWWEAVCAVETVEKGDVPRPAVAVLFASSLDVMWAEAPKLRVGQDGVWLLHRGPATTERPEMPGPRLPPGHVVIHPLDAHPREAAERIRRLIRERAGGQSSR